MENKIQKTNDLENPKVENSFVQFIKEKRQKSIIWIKANPKQIFIGMMVLTIISIIGNFIYYKYTIQNAKVTYKQMSETIFNPIDPKVEQKQQESVLEQAQNVIEMNRDLKRLNELKNQDVLSRQDSIEAKRLIQKYKLKH